MILIMLCMHSYGNQYLSCYIVNLSNYGTFTIFKNEQTSKLREIVQIFSYAVLYFTISLSVSLYWISFSLLLTQRLTVKSFDLICCEWPWSFSSFTFHFDLFLSIFSIDHKASTLIQAWLEHFVQVWCHQDPSVSPHGASV